MANFKMTPWQKLQFKNKITNLAHNSIDSLIIDAGKQEEVSMAGSEISEDERTLIISISLKEGKSWIE